MRVVTGIRVEKRTLTLPPGTTIGDEMCEDDPDDCCGTGTGTGTGTEPATGTGTGSVGPPITGCACLCCEDGIPQALTASFTAPGGWSSSDGGCMAGLSIGLLYDSDAETWTGSTTGTSGSCAGKTITATMWCEGPAWFFFVECGTSSHGNGLLTFTCDPIAFQFNLGFTAFGDCAPNVDFEVHVTE